MKRKKKKKEKMGEKNGQLVRKPDRSGRLHGNKVDK